MTNEFQSAAEFNAALAATKATPHDPIPGDGRTYYSGQDQSGNDVTFCEDNTGPTTRYLSM